MLEGRYQNINFENKDLRKKDFLDNLIYAKDLQAKIIEYYESDNNKPLYIALTGSWGSGKTTVAKTTIEMLKEYYKKDFRLFEFDAWKYEGDGFRRTFTKTILRQSGMDSEKPEYKTLENRLYDDKNVQTISYKDRFELAEHTDNNYSILIDEDGKKKLNKKLITVLAIISTILIVSVVLTILFPESLFAIVMAELFALAIVYFKSDGKELLKANVTYNFEKLFSPEQFYDTMNEILSNVKESKKLILIDNIDRCNDDDFKDTISSIKGFFNDSGKIVYLIPFDVSQFNNAFKKEYKSYSEKVFDDTVDIKEKSSKNVIEFVDRLLKEYPEYKPIFTDETLGIISSSNCQTPRQILSICNNFITEYNQFILKNKLENKNISNEDLSYLMKYSILKINHKELFGKIHINSDLIKRLEQLAFLRYEYKEVMERLEFKGWLDIESYTFLLRMYGIMPTNYDYFYESQNDSSFEIPKALENSILSRDFNHFDRLQEEDKLLIDKLIPYLKKSITFDKERNQWKMGIAPKFELLIHLLKNKKIEIDSIDENLGFVLKDDIFFSEMIFNQAININDSLYFIREYTNKYPKRNNFKKQLLEGLVNGKFSISTNKEVVTSKVLSEINFNDLNDNESNYINKHIETIVNSHSYKDEPHSNIFYSTNAVHISTDNFSKIFNQTSYDDIKILAPLINVAKLKVINDNDDKLFNKMIQFINKITSNVKDKNILHIIFDSLLELKEQTNWETRISELKISIPTEEDDTNLYRKIFEILLIKDNYYLKNILLSINHTDNKEQIISMLNNVDEIPSYLLTFGQDLISKFTEQEFEKFTPQIVKLYETSTSYESWLNQHIFSSRKKSLLYFYNNLNEASYKEIFIEYVLKQSLTFEQQLEFITFYESDMNRYTSFINSYQTIAEINKILETTEKKSYSKMTINRIIDVLDAKDNILDSDISGLEEVLKDERLTNTDKTKMLVIMSKKNVPSEKLLNIYNEIEKTPGNSTQIELVESILIEQGLIENNKNIRKTKKANILSNK